MTVYRNSGTETLVFRDDAPGKHFIEPATAFTIQGDQHAPRIAAMAGVEVLPDPEPLPEDATVADLRERADELGVKVPSVARKAEIAAAVAAVDPSAADIGGEG